VINLKNKLKKFKLLTVIIIAILFSACEPKGTSGKNPNAQSNNPENSATKEDLSESDSIRAWADGILSGKNIPTDDDMTFACLDSLANENKEVRMYYRKVYEVIDQQADGALSEALSTFIIDYFENFPQEAFDYYQQLDSNGKASIEFKMAEECYLEEGNALHSLDVFFADLQSRCPLCNVELTSAMKQKIKVKIIELNND
jgi:hypothetical protein